MEEAGRDSANFLGKSALFDLFPGEIQDLSTR